MKTSFSQFLGRKRRTESGFKALCLPAGGLGAIFSVWRFCNGFTAFCNTVVGGVKKLISRRDAKTRSFFVFEGGMA